MMIKKPCNERFEAQPAPFVCSACQGPVGIDSSACYVKIEATEPRPYGEAVCAMQTEPGLGFHEVSGWLCRSCTKRIWHIVDGIRANVLNASGQTN